MEVDLPESMLGKRSKPSRGMKGFVDYDNSPEDYATAFYEHSPALFGPHQYVFNQDISKVHPCDLTNNPAIVQPWGSQAKLALYLGFDLDAMSDHIQAVATDSALGLSQYLSGIEGDKFSNALTRGGIWGVMYKIPLAVSKADDFLSEPISQYFDRNSFRYQDLNAIKVKVASNYGISVSFVVTFYLKPEQHPGLFSVPQRSGVFSLFVFEQPLASGTQKQKITQDPQVCGSLGIAQIFKVLYHQAHSSIPVRIYQLDDPRVVDASKLRLLTPSRLSQNYCLTLFQNSAVSVPHQVLRQMAIMMFWRLPIKYDMLFPYFNKDAKKHQYLTFFKYKNVDLASLQNPEQSEPERVDFEKLVDLKSDIQQQLNEFLVFVEDDVILLRSYQAQLKQIFIANKQHALYIEEPLTQVQKADFRFLGDHPYASDKCDRPLVARDSQFSGPPQFHELIELSQILFQVIYKHDVPELAYSEFFISQLPRFIQFSTYLELKLQFIQFFAFLKSDTYKKLMLYPQVLLQSKKFRGLHSLDYPTDISPDFFAEFVGHVIFFAMFLYDHPSHDDEQIHQIKDLLERFNLFAYPIQRFRHYCQIRDSCKHFFAADEWSTGIRMYDKIITSSESLNPTLCDFIEALLDFGDKKTRIFVQSGKTNSGKSFSSNAWISLLFQLNGVVIGSKIDGDFQRVSNLGVRHLRIVEEYKGNILADFHHLESNGKQLYSNNAVIDARLSLAILNCDKSDFNLDDEAMSLLNRGSVSVLSTPQDILSRQKQVASRAFILNWEQPCNANFQSLSQKFKSANSLMARMFTDCILRLPKDESMLCPFEPVDLLQRFQVHHMIPTAEQEILLRWDLSLSQQMKYVQILQAFGDLTAWACALSPIFNAVISRELFDHRVIQAISVDRQTFGVVAAYQNCQGESQVQSHPQESDCSIGQF